MKAEAEGRAAVRRWIRAACTYAYACALFESTLSPPEIGAAAPGAPRRLCRPVPEAAETRVLAYVFAPTGG